MFQLLFPPDCAACGRRGSELCPQCRRSLAARHSWSPGVDGLDAMWSALDYQGDAKRLIQAIKRTRRRRCNEWLGARMAELVEDHDVDCVTWVPGSWKGWADRGFEPSKELARRVARELSLPARPVLARRLGPHQTGRSREMRLAGPSIWAKGAVPQRILVVDDVSTTGASLTAAARALREAGARTVYAVVAARTPSRLPA